MPGGRSTLLRSVVLGLLLALVPSWPGAALAATPAPASVGALFPLTTVLPHYCSASVVASPGADLVLTAAHCVLGTGQGLLFAPGYDRGRTPYGRWFVREVYLDAAWRDHQDPRHDYAVLRVDRQWRDGRWVGVQDVAGAAVLGVAPVDGTRVSVSGYAFGNNDPVRSCAAAVHRTAGYPTVDCAGLVAGTSGGPWQVADRGALRTVGVVGGLHQGGCTEQTSYSAPFTWRVYLPWLRAVLHAPSDLAPIPGGDGC